MKSRTIRRGAAALAAAALAAGAPAAAAQEDLVERVYELEQEIVVLRRQLETLMDGNRDTASEAASAAASETPEAPGDRVTMKGPAPTFRSADGNFSMSVTGRVHWDVGFYNESDTDRNLNDGSNLRRARLGVTGSAMKDFGYNIVLDGGDSAADDVDIDTAFVSYKGLKPLALTFGQHKAPLTLEDRTSSNDIPFIERSLGTNLFVGPAGGKRLGLSGVAHGDMWWVGAGVFGEKLGKDASTGRDEQWSYAGRIAFAPVREKTHGVHLGASGWLLPEPQAVETDDESGAGTYRNGSCRFRDRPEFRVDANRLIDARGKRNENCYGVGGELAFWYSPMWGGRGIHAVRGSTRSGRRVRRRRISTPGISRPVGCSRAKAAPTPCARRRGAASSRRTRSAPALRVRARFELVGRYSFADLNDGAIMGGEETNYTFGLNWFLNNWVALKFNYIRVDAEKGSRSDKFDIYGVRAQVKW